MLDTGAAGMRATKVSLVALGVTAALQGIVVVLSGSVALFSDTLHNLTDALTAVPLWIAFAVGRRPPTKRYTYGFHRVEDWAGLVIVGAIALSAVLVVWESVERLFAPRLLDEVGWVVAAGIVGGIGNEVVARYRIRVGRRIGSEALITDGRHARTDALTSLAVVVAGVGAWLDLPWLDPVAGLVVALPILWLLGTSARKVARRLLDGVEPEVVEVAMERAIAVPGVRSVDDLRARWHGHQLRIACSIGVDPDLRVVEGHEIAQGVARALEEGFPGRVVVTIHVEPHVTPDGEDAPDVARG